MPHSSGRARHGVTSSSNHRESCIASATIALCRSRQRQRHAPHRRDSAAPTVRRAEAEVDGGRAAEAALVLDVVGAVARTHAVGSVRLAVAAHEVLGLEGARGRAAAHEAAEVGLPARVAEVVGVARLRGWGACVRRSGRQRGRRRRRRRRRRRGRRGQVEAHAPWRRRPGRGASAPPPRASAWRRRRRRPRRPFARGSRREAREQEKTR